MQAALGMLLVLQPRSCLLSWATLQSSGVRAKEWLCASRSVKTSKFVMLGRSTFYSIFSKQDWKQAGGEAASRFFARLDTSLCFSTILPASSIFSFWTVCTEEQDRYASLVFYGVRNRPVGRRRGICFFAGLSEACSTPWVGG